MWDRGGCRGQDKGLTVPSLAGAVPGGPSASGQGVSSQPLVAQTLLWPRAPRLGFSLSPPAITASSSLLCLGPGDTFSVVFLSGTH